MPAWEAQPAPEEDEDLPPEFCQYRDEGCELSGSCLDCPLPRCIHDEPGGRQRWLKRQRDREIARLFRREGKRIRELAQMFGLSQRTVKRALHRSIVNTTRQSKGESGRHE
ncbi:MAG: sigma-70 family RNA polymerase sigma factor [Chloroflexi bacterium]|nr:sigma-70 family RNA polymerase sigma factor [Chloroflexota bacterium]